MAGCLRSLPPIAPVATAKSLELPSQRRAVEALVESVEEALASPHPTVTLIIGEWGEGKTYAWTVVVEPLYRARGYSTFTVRASTLFDVLSGVGGRSWAERLVNALKTLTPRCCERLAVFIDEAEDLIHRGELEKLLEALHGLIDGEASVTSLHVYVGMSPYALARAKTWVTWRRLERRVRIVELKPVSVAEAVWAVKALIEAYAGSLDAVLEDPRLANAIALASRGNMGALVVYVRRVLAAWSARGCRRLTAREIAELLSENVAAGVVEGGIDRLYARELEKQGLLDKALMVLSSVETPIHEPVEAEPVDKPFEGMGFLDESGRLLRVGAGGVRVYILSEEHVSRLFGVRGSIAPFILDSGERREALREAFDKPWLSALGLAHALCRVVSCLSTPRCIAGCRGAVLEARLSGVRTRIAIVTPGVDALTLRGSKPHLVVCLGAGCSYDAAPVSNLRLSPVDTLALAALAVASSRGLRIDRVVLDAYAAYLDARYKLVETLVKCLVECEPRVYVPRHRIDSSTLREAARVMALLALYGGVASIDQVAKRLGSSVARIRGLLEKLSKLEMVDVIGDLVAYRVSPLERTIARMLREHGGSMRVEEILERLAWETPQSVVAVLRLMEARGVVKTPKRLSRNATIRLASEPSLAALVATAPTLLAEHMEREKRHEKRQRVTPAHQPQRQVQPESHAILQPRLQKREAVEHRVQERWVKLVERRRLEAQRLIEYLRAEGRAGDLERVYDEVAAALADARRGRVEDAAVQLADVLAEYSRQPPSIDGEILSIIEDQFAKLRAAERIAARRAEALAAQAFYLTALKLALREALQRHPRGP